MRIATAKGRLVKRIVPVRPAFHETDLMGVIHNSVYFLWFEAGRMELLEDVLPVEEAMARGVALPVVDNACHYRKAAKFGMPLLLYTTHHVQAAYQGRLVFNHYLIHEKQKTAMAFGQSAITLVDAQTHRLIKTWPQDIWERYQALK